MTMNRTGTKVGVLMLALAVMMAGVPPLFALLLEEAKAKGLMGERANGYLGVVYKADGEAQALVRDIN